MICAAVEVSAKVRARLDLEQAAVDRELLLAQAEAASRAKDEFFAMLGHELRNPLSPILTALDLMKLKNIQGAVREQAIIERQVRHMVRLVDDLLDVSRIAQGKIELRIEPVNVAAVVAAAVEMASPVLDEKAHAVHIEVATDLVVDGDVDRLGQVIANLLTNAAKYTDVGGHVRITAARNGEQIELSVADNGCGITATMLPRVFDLFSQERQDIDRSQGGLGLGLALVKNLVALHGGTVSAASAGRGQGSTFSLRLPASWQHVTPTLRPVSRSTTRRPSVLIVDDNEDAADLLASALGTFGCETRVAYDGSEALAVVETFTPDVALLDLGLPVMDGYELGASLRARPELHSLRVIVLSGYGQQADRDRTLAAGFEAHLVKPVNLQALLELLSTPLA